MNSELLNRAIGNIDDDLILSADNIEIYKASAHKMNLIRIVSLAASFVILISGFLVFRHYNSLNPTEQTKQSEETEEGMVTESYLYHITEGPYSSYFAGKVINEELIGKKIGETKVSASWHYTYKEETGPEEILRADIYEIKGIPVSVAVCLKFSDKGDALTTTHYYVQINPEGDSSLVEDYLIGSSDERLPANEKEITNDEVITEYTQVPEK